MSQSPTPLLDALLHGGLAVAGSGVPLIVALTNTLQATAAITNGINFKPPLTANQLYRISAYVDVTAWTTPANFTIVATFKNAEGTSKTITLATNEDDGTASAVIDEVSGFAAVPFLFEVDNSGTAITLSTTGTFTGSPVYDFFGTLERLQ
jgi:hypothetical protein